MNFRILMSEGARFKRHEGVDSENDNLPVMPNLLSITRRAPLWVFVLFVIVLLVVVVVCLLPTPTGHSIHLAEDHMLGVAPVLSLIAMVLIATSFNRSMTLSRRLTAPKSSLNSSQLIQAPLLVNSQTRLSVPLRR